jgi:hypothetical protein
MRKNIVIAVISFVVGAALVLGIGRCNRPFIPEDNPEYTYKAEKASLNIEEANTRRATIKIFTPSGGHGSGSLYYYKDKFIVLTAGHVVEEEGLYVLVDKWGEERFGSLIYTDSKHDFAVISTTEFSKTRPLWLKLPPYDIRKNIDRGLIFSGYPSSLPLLTTRGKAAGFRGEVLYMHSAAWMGSSGSNVFDHSGNFIGILYGVSIGQFAGLPALMEDMIWVTPHYALDWRAINKAIKERG